MRWLNPAKAQVRAQFVNGRAWLNWRRRMWSSPSAPSVKRGVLARHHIAGATWVETGTYRGDTTAFLAKLGGRVISLEPDDGLYSKTSRRFVGDDRVTLLHGTSESLFIDVVASVKGPVCFWLDGHYSGPGTFLADSPTPVSWELEVIARNLGRLSDVAVLVDDFREFPSRERIAGDESYPTREALVSWAVANSLDWTVEHDIFIATSSALNG